ncbi:MAG: phospholipase D-like domain-containing protein [Chloroflexota bacterium]
MGHNATTSLLLRLVAAIFLRIRRLAGPVRGHRVPRRTLSGEDLPPLPPEWLGDDRWYRGGFPPRAKNEILPLIDGEMYFSDLLRSLRGAQTRVTICGWCLTPLMSLAPSDSSDDAILGRVLAEVSQHARVYILLWSGAPLLFEPTSHFQQQIKHELLELAPNVHFALDKSAPFSHDHHQKAVTIDGNIAYVGGMDLTTFQGNRWDRRDHSLRYGPNWHDVQLRIAGESVADVEQNFLQRWQATTGVALETIDPFVDDSWTTPVQVLRTIPSSVYSFASQGEFGIRHAMLAAIKRANHFIYLENQYLWAPEIRDALLDAMQRNRNRPFRVLVVLPASAYEGKYDNDQHVRTLQTAERASEVFHAYSLYTAAPASGPTGYRYAPIYVHAKVAIIDDEWMCIGSANLNRRGFATDSEIDAQAVSSTISRDLRLSLWAEHLGTSEEDLKDSNPIDVIDRLWTESSRRMERCLRTGGIPPAGHVHPYVPGKDPTSRLLDVVQALTLEH